jgi:hypothetical protein
LIVGILPPFLQGGAEKFAAIPPLLVLLSIAFLF